MKAILFIDTETSDMVHWHEPPGPSQPHMVQLGALLVAQGYKAEIDTVIKPDGWTIAPGAMAVHGITLDRCQAEGVPVADVLAVLEFMADRAELVVAHNIDFDAKIVLSECSRNAYQRLSSLLCSIPFYCTMKESTDILQLPGGPRGWKWPKLHEAYKFFTGKDLQGAHDAMTDVLACKEVFEAIQTWPHHANA